MDMNDKQYEKRIVYLFFLIWGLTFFNRLSINFVMPVIQKDLNMTASHIGTITFTSTISMAISSIIIGRISDKTGKRKKYLLPATISVGVFSMAALFVNSFNAFVILRILVGIGLGPILSLIFSITEAASSDNSFGKNTGIILVGDAIIANIFGPIVTTQLTGVMSWQLALCITSIPTVLVGILGYKVIREESPIAIDNDMNKEKDSFQKEKHRVRDVFKYPNMIVCMLLTILTLGGYFIIVTYAPIYLTEISGHSVSTMGIITSIMGIIFVPYAMFIPRLTDKLGRKPVMIVAIILSAIAPFSMYLFPNSNLSIFAYVLFGGISGSIGVFFNAIIPMEGLPDDLKTTGSSILFTGGEIIGAAVIPLIAGIFADGYGYEIVMLFSTVIFVLAFAISFALKESNKSIMTNKI